MTMYTVFHDARKANTENNHIHEKEVKSLFKVQTENKESKRWVASHLTLQIGNLEHKPKASHSQITVHSRPVDMELSELLVRDS